MSVLAVIPARGGSKGIPRKNIRSLAGKPLIAWTIEAAMASKSIDRLVVSTDDVEIAEVARHHGADVPFLRPAELATDAAPGVGPAIHAAETLGGFEWLLLLQPTSPLRSSEDIDGIVALCRDTGSPSAVSVCAAEVHPAWMFRMGPDRALEPVLDGGGTQKPRQELEPVFVLNGALYLARIEWLKRTRSFVGAGTLGYPMPSDRSVDIDSPRDWDEAEHLLGGGGG